VIHISTDAVFSGRLLRPYTATDPPDPIDVYGMTKALGESPAGNVLNIRCSIVGRDSRCRGLIEWYRGATSPSVTGFVDYVWTPVTTVQVADFCAALVRGDFDRYRVKGHVLHFAPNVPLSKATFLEYLREALGGGPSIEASPGPGGPCHRVLASDDEKAPGSQPRDWPGLFSEVFAEFSSRGV
jgi:dTDP-4-dehydrorhamnose reductase